MYSDYIGNSQRSSLSPTGGVKSTSLVTENHYKNGYVNNKNYIMINEDNSDTKYTINNDTNNHDTAICTSEHSSAPVVVFPVLMIMCHTTLPQVVHVSVFVMATTGAASVLAGSSPPFLASCATLRISTRAPLWTRLPAPCSPRSNESPARLPPVVASEEWALGSATDVGKPVRPGPSEWVTSSWALLVLLPAVKTWLWLMPKPLPRLASQSISPLLTSRLASRSAFARFPQAPFCTSPPVVAYA